MRYQFINKTKLYLSIAIINLLFVLSCNEKKHIENKIDFSFEKLSESTISETISNYSIVTLETTEDSKVNIIKKIVIKNERIYILNHQENKQEILIFSMNGEYINKIPKKSKGEDDFLSIVDFDIHPVNGHIAILDQKQKRFVTFNESTKFINSNKINFLAKEIAYGIKDGKVYMVIHAKASKEDSDINFEIITYDENDNLSETFFPFDRKMISVQSDKPTIMKRGGKVMFLEAGTNSLYEIDLRKYKKKSNLTFSKPVLPVDKMYGAFYRGEVDLTNYIYNVDYFESDRIVYITFSGINGDYIGIYDKEACSSSLFNMLLDPSCKCGMKIDIVGSFKNYFIVQIPRIKISNVMDVLDNERIKCSNKNMFEIIDNMKPGENPILLLLELKYQTDEA